MKKAIKENIRKEIRNILKEIQGEQEEVKKISDKITTHILSLINFHKTQEDFRHFKSGFFYDASEDIIKKTGISSVEVTVIFNISDDAKLSGKFKPNSTKRLEDGSFSIGIDIEFSSSMEELEDMSELDKKIISIVSHELNHAFVFVQKYNKSQSPINTINRAMMLEFFDKPALIRFLKMIYLTIPEEMQARVQEAGALLDKLEASNYHDAIRELYRFQPINDASKMIKYNVDEVLVLDDALLERFIESFFANLKSFGSKKNISKNPELFFMHFLGEIRTKGIELNKKIMKLVAQKFNSEDKLLKEGSDSDWNHLMLYLYKDGDLFEDIFGFDLNGWD